MADEPKLEDKDKAEAPAPEALSVQTDETSQSALDDDTTSSSASSPATSSTPSVPATPVRSKHRNSYRPSHKATLIGLGVVLLILGVNAAIIGFVVMSQAKADVNQNASEVTISSETLDKLGVSRNVVGNSSAELVVNPKAKFNGTVTIAGDTTLGGQLKINGKFVAGDASFAKLEAGDTSISKLGVNGDATVTNLNLRKDLTVVGATRLQGPVTISQLVTVANSLNVAGNLSIGGSLSVRNLHASSFVSDSTLTIGGHIITRGSAPGVSAGSVGSNGNVSISGNDASGTVAVNVGVGGASGIVATVGFRSAYSSTPHVVVTQVGAGGNGVFVTRSSTGFSIGVNGSLGPGGYAFDYIVMQ